MIRSRLYVGLVIDRVHQTMNNLNCSVVIKTTEIHTGGQPLRIAVSGYPDISGDTILDKRRYVKKNLDHLRKMLMHEPRGHKEMYGIIPVTADIQEADVAMLFMHNEGYSVMCGDATIAMRRYAVDHGIVEAVSPETVVKVQCPCGLVTAYVQYEDGKSGAIRFESVPSFLFATDLTIDSLDYGVIHYHISFGGSYYVYTDITQFKLDMDSSPIDDIVTAAMKLKTAVAAAVPLSHPEHDDLAFLYGVHFYSGPLGSASNSLTIYADGQVDRSPCGSGSSGLLALLYHKGLVKEGEVRKIANGKTGSVFRGKVVKQVKYKLKDKPAVITEVSGRAYYTGESTFYCEQDDAQPYFIIK